MRDIVVYGASGHAKVLLGVLGRMSEYEIAGLIADKAELTCREMFGYRVLRGRESLHEVKTLGVEAGIVEIGDNRIRGVLASKVEKHGLELINVIHPSACISRGVHLGPGLAIRANSVVNADSCLGRDVIVNSVAFVSYDDLIGGCVHVSSGARLGGGVSVGAYSLLGIGTIVIPSIRIGEDVKMAARSVVTEVLPDGAIAARVPLMVITRKNV